MLKNAFEPRIRSSLVTGLCELSKSCQLLKPRRIMVQSSTKEPLSDKIGLLETLAVARDGAMASTCEGDARLTQ